MPATLGLDLGSNSIGWALVEDNKALIDIGVRIFPRGVDNYKAPDVPSNGTEVTPNATRRSARGARRNLHRFKLRQRDLKAILDVKDMLPLSNEGITASYVYGLRKSGLDQKLALEEIGRVLLLINSRRGFKSNRKAERSNKEGKASEDGVVKTEIGKLQAAMQKRGSRTVGEYFSTLIDEVNEFVYKPNPNPFMKTEDNPEGRIRNHYVSRSMLVDEFDLIWQKQTVFYPDVLTEKMRRVVRDEIIFYQRPLKSAKHLLGNCALEPGKKVIPASHPLFQEFRMLQKVNDLRMNGGEYVDTPIKEKYYENLLYLINEKGVFKAKGDHLAHVGIPKGVKLNMEGDIRGPSTMIAIRDAVGRQKLEEIGLERLWHTNYFFDDPDKLADYATKAFGLTQKQADDYARIRLEADYGRFSAKAIKKILPGLREGNNLWDATLMAGYTPPQASQKKDPNIPLREPEMLEALQNHELRNPVVQAIVAEAIRLINAVAKEHGYPDQIRIEMARELKKPRKVREEMFANNNKKNQERQDMAYFLTQELRKHNPDARPVFPGDAAMDRYELWLELGLDPNASAYDRYHELEKLGLKKGDPALKEKFKLWYECNRISVYSGKAISLSALLSKDSEIEIEHIYPYSKTMDNSFTNKSLCERAINMAKDKRLPMEYFITLGPASMHAFETRVNSSPLSAEKKKRLLAKSIPEEFASNQLNNTSWAARLVKGHVERAYPGRVQVTQGTVTSLLRKGWNLHKMLKEQPLPVKVEKSKPLPTIEDTSSDAMEIITLNDPARKEVPKGEKKARDDHRHHAIDALVVACTTLGVTNAIQREAGLTGWGNLRVEVKPPWPSFSFDVADRVNTLLVSYRNGKRLMTTRTNMIKNKHEGGKKDKFKQKILGVRGELHEETIYGKINNPHAGGEETYVVAKSLSYFQKVEQLKEIIDPALRQMLLNRVATFNGDVKKAMATNSEDPILMYSPNKGARIPIRKVRIKVRAQSTMVPIRALPDTEGENTKYHYVTPGNNYIMAIYEGTNAKGKVVRAFETVPFLVAVQRKQDKKEVYPHAKDGLPLLMTLMQGDLVMRYTGHPDSLDWNDKAYLFENLFQIVKFGQDGRIGIKLHRAANADSNSAIPDLAYKPSANTFYAVKVRIDTLGKLHII